jgi:hypothetical protein
MKSIFDLISNRGFFIVTITVLLLFGCSAQDEFKKELPPVTEKVFFTPSESSKVKPVGMDGK